MKRHHAQPLIHVVGHDQAHVFITICGEVRITGRDDVPVPVRGNQPSSVLAYLVLAETPVLRDELARLLWGDDLPKHWQGALRGVVSKIRAAFVAAGMSDQSVRSEGGKVGFAVGMSVQSDVGEARAAFDRAKVHYMAGDYHDAVEQCVVVTNILERPFLFRDSSEWAVIERSRLGELATQTTHLHLEALRALPGATKAAIERARQQVSRNPLDEIAYHQLIEALLRSGQRTAALEAYENLANSLYYELGINPESHTTALVEAIKASVGKSAGPPVAQEANNVSSLRMLHPYDADPFVGRVSELASLNERWADVMAQGNPQIVLLEGPAGVGKSRLASRFCHWVASSGAAIVWGRSREGSTGAYGALAEALAMALRASPDTLARIGSSAAPISALLPEFTEYFGSYELPNEPTIARAQLYEAFRVTVEELVKSPAVLVLDDLQWASPDTLDLLEYLLGWLQVPLLIVATNRSLPSQVHRSLAALQRLVPFHKLPLTGLSVAELVELVGEGVEGPLRGGHSSSYYAQATELATLLHSRTGGLAFFGAEIARAARSSGVPIDPLSIPVAARDWVVHRVASLPDSHIQLLEWASTLGTSINIELLEECVASGGIDVFDQCDSLVEYGFFTDALDDGTIEFSHAITREVIYEGLSRTRRIWLHRHVAGVLARRHRSQIKVTPQEHGQLAYHYSRSGSGGLSQAAVQALYAGEKSLAQGAWESALTYFDDAIHLKPEPEVAARALTGLGRANQYLGQAEAALEHIQNAVGLAREWELAIDLANAHLTMVGRAGRGILELSDGEQVRLMRESLTALVRDEKKYLEANVEPTPGIPSDKYRYEIVRGMVEQELALALLFTGTYEERRQLLEASLERVRRSQPANPTAVVASLFGMRIVKLDGPGIRSRLADLDAVLAVPTRKTGSEAVVAAHTYRHEDLVILQQWNEAVGALKEASFYANTYSLPYWQWAIHTWRGLWANIKGDLGAAEALAFEAAGMRPDVAGAEACVGVNLVNIRLYQGRVHEMLDLLAGAVEGFPLIPCYRAVLSLCATEASEAELAEQTYRFFADADFTNLPMDSNRFLGLGVLAHVAVELGDTEGGQQLANLLGPYRDCWITLNCYGGGGAHWGPTTHQLGRLAYLGGRSDEARRLLKSALDSADRANAPLVRQRVEADLGRITDN